MSLLLGETFADICETVWGKDWKIHAAKRLRRSERQLYNIETGVNNVSSALKREMLCVVREQIVLLSAHEREILR